MMSDRAEDIPLMVERFIPAEKHRRELKQISRDYAWPDNIRQVRNVLERLMITVGEHMNPEL